MWQEIWQGAPDDSLLPGLMIFQWICSIGYELLLINCLFDIEILSNHIAGDDEWLNYKQTKMF